jgi:hypothetical protein
MTTNEIITICIASAALLVSLVTMYFTHFHKKLGLIGCLAAYNTESDSNPLYGNYEFSLSNTGNRELLVWEAQLDLVGAIGQYTVPEVPSSELPTVIKPGQILLLSFGIPVLFMRNAAKSGYKVLVRFHGFSPEAKSFFLSKCLVPQCDGVLYTDLPSQEVLWDKYSTGAPAQQRQCVERYSIVKRA